MKLKTQNIKWWKTKNVIKKPIKNNDSQLQSFAQLFDLFTSNWLKVNIR